VYSAKLQHEITGRKIYLNFNSVLLVIQCCWTLCFYQMNFYHFSRHLHHSLSDPNSEPVLARASLSMSFLLQDVFCSYFFLSCKIPRGLCFWPESRGSLQPTNSRLRYCFLVSFLTCSSEASLCAFCSLKFSQFLFLCWGLNGCVLLYVRLLSVIPQVYGLR